MEASEAKSSDDLFGRTVRSRNPSVGNATGGAYIDSRSSHALPHWPTYSYALSCSTRHDPCIAKVDTIPKSRCPDLSVGYRNERREMRRVTPTRPEEKPPPSLAYDTRYHPLAVQIIFRKTWGNFDPEPSNRIHRGRNLGPVWFDRILRSYRTKPVQSFFVFF